VVTRYAPRPAARYQAKLRMALAGLSGAGKTFTGLRFAAALGQRICVIDAERGSSQKYAEIEGMPAFDIIILDAFSPDEYCSAIEASIGYDVLLIDSISPEWIATLEIVDEATAMSQSNNKYTVGWRTATPLHNKFVETMMQYPGHLIATIRQKVKYILIDTGQGQVPRRAGFELQQRDYLEHEFDLIGELDVTHKIEIVKSRCPEMTGKIVRNPDATFMDPIRAWLSTGRKIYTLPELFTQVKASGYGEDDLRARMAAITPGVTKFAQLTAPQIEALYESFAVPVNGGRA
jgi:AAA domain